MLEIIYSKIISYYYNNPLNSYFKIKKIWELVARKSFWPTFCQDVKVYVKGYDVCLASKAVRHKPYRIF